VVGDRTVDEVLTFGAPAGAGGRTRLQDLMDRYPGHQIEHWSIRTSTRPIGQEFVQQVNSPTGPRKPDHEARSEYNKVVPRARGEAQQLIQQAEGYAIERPHQARGAVARFEAMLAAWRFAPAITTQRMYLETMQHVLPQIGRKVLIDPQARSVLPLLQLGGPEAAGAPAKRGK
jgi:membrane protease subunit HflK